MEDNQQLLQSSSFMPLLSRVDRLDSVMKYMEKKEKLSRSKKCTSSSIGRKNNNLSNVAPHSKASILMDRILSLENRLLQLSQEIEVMSRISSSDSSIQSRFTGSNKSSSNNINIVGSKNELPLITNFTYPIIQPKPKPESPLHTTASTTEEHSTTRKKQRRPRRQRQQQQQQKDGDDQDKTCKNEHKNNMPPLPWPRLRIFGC